MKPYVLVSPPFNITSGGIRVMWGLYGWLLAKGQIAYMNERPRGEVIAIYPEIQAGNPANTNNIVRYVLNTPGVMGGVDENGQFRPGPSMFNESENIYYFSRLFGQAKDDNHYLFLPILDLHIFKDNKKKRAKKAVLFGKGGEQPLIGINDCVVIDRKFANDQQALADLLNECEVLYCFDPVTAMTEIARLCGCRVVIIPSRFTKEEFIKYEPGMYGVSWGLFEWEKDKEDKFFSGIFREHYEKMVKEFSDKLDILIDETQS